MHGRPWLGRLSLGQRTLTVAASLVVLVALGGFVRAIGIDFGRPFAYHPDEWIIFKPALTMIHDRDWNPHVFWYSSLLIDMQALVTAVIRQFGGPSIETGQGWIFDGELLPQQFRYLLGGRLMVLGLGLASIPIVFEVARRLRGAVPGLVAAALLATMPLHISDSRYLTTDVPVALFCAVTLLLTIKADADRRDRWWLAAGIAAGLATSTKWNGAIVLGVPLLAYLLPSNSLREVIARLRTRTPYLIVVAAAVALVATTPAVLLDTGAIIEFFRVQGGIYSQPRPGITGEIWILNMRGLAAGLGPILTVVAGLGLARCLLRPRRRVELTIPAFVVVTMIIVSLPARQFDRNMVPVLPYLAVASACFLADLPGMVRRAADRRGGSAVGRSVQRGAAAAIVIALIASVGLNVGAGVASGRRVSEPDTRTIARDWLLANVEPRSVIAREMETPLLLPGEFRLRVRKYLPTHTLQWYRDAGTQLLVTSSGAYDRYVGNPATPEADTWYRVMFELPEVFRIEPGQDHRGPTIRIYQLAPFTYRGGAPSG